ncbi:MAG: metal-dependent hydrolase [Gammaproteobacteria bacterium AqS3]|nr:metal-dependent hydrolase [Gammaproteobacteria bacterium AqS3]
MSRTEPAQQDGRKLAVRKIPFDFEETIDPVWHPGKPEWSHMINGASLTMPYLEPFLIRTVREAMQHITDPQLLADAHGFNAQEAQHYKNHRRYNERLKANGYPELAEIEALMEADYENFQTKPLKWRLAYAAGFETMTIGITHWTITNRRRLFAGANPSVVSFVLWHMVEEAEHKTVAFDLYQALYGDYLARIWGIWCGSWHVVRYTHKGYKLMLKKDGLWSRLKSRLRLAKMEADFLVNVGKFLLGSLMPGHHPERVADPEWVGQWADAYRGLDADTIPLLDTDHPDIPARFIAQ